MMSLPIEVDTAGCWLWTGSISSTGYGTHTYSGPSRRTVLAHRMVYELHRGTIPVGHDLDHLCRVTRCVNPSHLEPVTPAENCHRGAKTKLTAEQVSAIRATYAAGEATQPELAARFGVHNATISRIIRGERWPFTERPRRVA